MHCITMCCGVISSHCEEEKMNLKRYYKNGATIDIFDCKFFSIRKCNFDKWAMIKFFQECRKRTFIPFW